VVRVCCAGAEAPSPHLRVPSVGGPRPRGGLGYPVRRCVAFPSGPRAFRSSCFAEAWQRPTRCAVVHPGPRAFLSTCFAEALQADTVPLFVRTRGSGRVPALPKQCWADTSRLTEVSWARLRRDGSGVHPCGCGAAEDHSPKRLALDLPLRAEARGGELPVASRGSGLGGASPLVRPAASRVFALEEALFFEKRARATSFPKRKAWNH
jgi:hypothetical protein